MHINHLLLIHSSIDWHLGCFHFFLLLYIMLLLTFMYRFLCKHIFFISLRYFPRNIILGSCSSFIFVALQAAFQNGCTILHSHQWRTRFPISAYFIKTHSCVLNFSHPSRCEVVFSLWVWFSLPWRLKMLVHLLMYCLLFAYPLCRKSSSNPLLILIKLLSLD